MRSECGMVDWLVVERRIIGVETFYHPLNRVWHRQDGCETTVMTGEWTSANRSDKQHKRRRKLVHIVRYTGPVLQLSCAR